MAFVGFSTALTVNDTSAGTVYTAIPEVIDIAFGGRETGVVDITTLNQRNGSTIVYEKTFMPSRVVNPGQIKLQVQWTPAVFTRFKALESIDYQAPTVATNWKLTAPDPDGAGSIVAQTYAVNGFVFKIGDIKFERENQLMFEVDIQISGPWTLTGGS